MRKIFAFVMLLALVLGTVSCATSRRGVGCPSDPTAMRRR